MSEWKKVSLDQMGTVSRGKSKHRPRNDARLFGGKYPFIQTGDIGSAGLYVNEFSQTYNEEGLAQSKLWEKDTLCITIAANIADTALLAFPACFPDSIMGFVADPKKSNVKFVKYCFDILQKDCKQISQGAAQDNLSWKKLSTIEFPCPPIEVQNRIATILSRYDSLIENYQKQIKLLEEAAQRLYKEWFIDLHYHGHENTNIIDGVPEGWENTNVNGIVTFHRGYDLTHSEMIDGKYPVIGSTSIIGTHKDYKINGPGIVTGRSGSLGKFQLIQSDFWPHNTTLYISDFKGHDVYYIYCMLSRLDFASLNNGGAIPTLNRNVLSNISVLEPDSKVQKEFTKIVTPMFIKREHLQSQLRLLTEARDRLLPKLMSGAIEV